MEYDRIKVEEMTMDNITKINVPDIPDSVHSDELGSVGTISTGSVNRQ